MPPVPHPVAARRAQPKELFPSPTTCFLVPFHVIVREPGDAARLPQTLVRLRPSLQRSRLTPPRPVANTLVRHRLEHRIHHRRTLLTRRRLQLRGERCQGLLGSLEADLAGLHVVFLLLDAAWNSDSGVTGSDRPASNTP
jgi:hypothetical protein